jgi:hypothetical protein
MPEVRRKAEKRTMFLYAKGTDVRITVPSISIEDIKLPEDLYKADFELSGRYQEFVKEMIRFSLLGLAGYGFLIEKVVGTAHLTMMATGTTFILVLIGIFCLVCSAGVGLYCGQLNRACILMQVSILRLLQRRQADRWTDPGLSSAADVERWKAANEEDLKTLRNGQAANLRRAHTMQRATVWLLLIGIVVTALVFIRCLYMNVQPS